MTLSATRYLELVADRQRPGPGARDRRRTASRCCSAFIRDDVSPRSAGSPLPGARGERSALDRRPACPQRWSLPMAASEGTGEVTSAAPECGRVAGRAERCQRCPSGGPAPASGEERSHRRGSRQLHEADANLLVRGLFRGRAPDNRDDVRAALGAATPIAADATIAVRNASRYYLKR